MKQKIMSVILASLILTGCGGNQLSEVAESVETTAITTAATITDKAKTTTEITATTSKTTTTQTATEITEKTTTTIPEPTEDDEGGVFDVERGFFVTRLTFPISTIKAFDENYDPEQNLAKLKEENEDWLLSAEIDGDNVVYMMKTKEYNKWRKETIRGIEEEIEKTISEENTIIDITHDDDYGNLYFYVTDEETYRKSWDSLNVMGFAVGIGLSNSMLGFFNDTITVHVIDSQTGVEFKTDIYPEKSDE